MGILSNLEVITVVSMAAEFIAVELAVDSEGIDIVRVRANGC
jgi:hypothetical protein